MKNPYQNEFIALFDQLAPGKERYTLFCDFVRITASILHEQLVERKSIDVVLAGIPQQFQAEDLRRITKLIALISLALDARRGDFLGEVFSSLELGGPLSGLDFMPYDQSLDIAKGMSGSLEMLMEHQSHLSLLELSCGTGSQAIAKAQVFELAGYDVQQQLFIQCVDVNPVVTDMCFIQLALLDIPAQIITASAYGLHAYKVKYTPVYYVLEWEQRLRKVESGLHSFH